MRPAMRNPNPLLEYSSKLNGYDQRARMPQKALCHAGVLQALAVSHCEMANPWQSVIDGSVGSCDIRLRRKKYPTLRYGKVIRV